jgi:CheY-like chemotaxis protein
MPPKTMLIVEDEPLIRMCAVDFAEEAGYRAFEAKDAGEALVVLESGEEIGLLFTDITLPGPMDGLELAALVAERWPQIGIMLASGALGSLEASVAPSAHRLPKPYGFHQFTEALDQLNASATALR